MAFADLAMRSGAGTWRRNAIQFIEPFKRYADINVQRGGSNRIAIDMIKAKMRELLNEHT